MEPLRESASKHAVSFWKGGKEGRKEAGGREGQAQDREEEGGLTTYSSMTTDKFYN
jgi:hypothetical protein